MRNPLTALPRPRLAAAALLAATLCLPAAWAKDAPAPRSVVSEVVGAGSQGLYEGRVVIAITLPGDKP